MKKLLKFVGIVLGVFLALALLLVLTLPLWIGGVVKTAANTAVPPMTGTEFKLNGFSCNWYNGRLEISDVKLSNPEGFDQKMAFTLGKVFVDVDMSTIFSDPMVIEKIEVKDVFVSYLDGSHGTNNFDMITANVKDFLGVEPESDEDETGDEKAKVAEKKEGEAKEAETAEKKDEEAPAEEEKGGPGRKFIIDDILIDSVVVQYGAVTLPLKMPIHLTGIGRDLGGINAENAWKEIFSQFWRSLTNIGSGILSLGASGVDKAGELLDNLKVKDGAESAVKATSEAVDKAGVKVKDGAESAVKATSEAVDKASGAIKNLFK